MALADRFAHTMRVVRITASGSNIDGQRDEVETLGPIVDCLLTTAPAAGEDTPIGRRTRATPTLLCDAAARDATATAIRVGDVIEVAAPEIHAAEGLADPSRYQIEDRPQPLARPGDAPMGFNATLSLVKD